MKKGRNLKIIIFLLLAGVCLLPSCNKNNFLDKKPSSDLVIPKTLDDCQVLLDNYLVMEQTPELGEISADNFYLNDVGWKGLLSIKEKNAYVWAVDIYEGQGGVEDWDDPYSQVFYANVVLEALPGIQVDSMGKWKNLQGAAYFIRAYAFYNLAQVFADVYNPIGTNDGQGIPLRLSADVDQPSTRASLYDTYQRILSDLQTASSLLPNNRDIAHLNRPSKPAALAMLARVYLSMSDYNNAGIYANSCLKMYDSLIDYNTLPDTTINPFVLTNTEVLYQSQLLPSGVLVAKHQKNAFVDSNLYHSYADSDLRKVMFYEPNGNIKEGYNFGLYPFTGLAIDEVYLIRAECYARHDSATYAINDLNTLLVNRWVKGRYTPYVPGSPDAALDTVLAERRKELPFRGLRWTDLRRLNIGGANITLTRPEALSPLISGDLRYVLPIPPDVISLGGIIQNQR